MARLRTVENQDGVMCPERSGSGCGEVVSVLTSTFRKTVDYSAAAYLSVIVNRGGQVRYSTTPLPSPLIRYLSPLLIYVIPLLRYLTLLLVRE